MSIMKTVQDIKKTLLAVLCSSATTGVMADHANMWNDFLPYGQSLETVESVITALDSGATVSAAVDLSKCTPQDDGLASTIRGGMRISSYRITDNDALWFEDTFLSVLSSPGRADPVRVVLRYLASPGGAVKVTSFVYSVPDYTLISENNYDCSIDMGVSFNIIY
jgi:hypothetical protein